MDERKKILFEVNSALNKVKEKNGYKIKNRDLKETFNYLIKVKGLIETSNLPEREKNLYNLRIYQVL
ncbi:MAG: hypothetical protein NZ942_00040, partial [Candidatus Aenigmarchaeota archaeon]|nr:hypothetical protein [Candidatus Aenigmarchaeota archaeon]